MKITFRSGPLRKFAIFFTTFLLIISGNLAHGVEKNTRLLLLVDTSKSVGVEGISSFVPLLEEITKNDSIAKLTTMIHYPTSTGPRLVTFENSAEIDSILKVFIPSFGGSELKFVFEKAKIWKQNIQNADVKVIWITDGGGLRKLGQDYSIPAQLELIAPLENWLVVDMGEDNFTKSIQAVVGSYRYLNPRDVFSPDRLEVSQLIGQPSSVDSDSMNFRFSLNAFLISLLLSIIVYLILSPIFAKIFSQSQRKLRRNLIGAQHKSLDLLKTKDPFIWRKLPRYWKRPLENFLDSNYEKRSLNKVLNSFLASILVFALVFFPLIKNLLASITISLLINPFLYKFLNKIMQSKLDKEFDKSLAGILTLASSGLRSGLSLEHGLEAYAKMNENNSAKEIRRVLGEVKLGASLEEALQDLATRRKCEDLNWVVEAISIQRNIGGSLSTIIDTVVQTISERSELRREVRTLSAEGRLSAYVLLALPLGIFSFLFVSRRDYVEVFWTEPLGFLVLGIIAALITIGWFWMKKVVTIKV